MIVFQMSKLLTGKAFIIGLLFVVALLNILMVPLEGVGKDVRENAKQSQENEFTKDDLNSALSKIRSTNIWNVSESDDTNEIVEPAMSLNQEGWHLVALIKSNNRYEAILGNGNEFFHGLVEGDTLQTGEKIVSIIDETLVLDVEGESIQLSLFPDSI